MNVLEKNNNANFNGKMSSKKQIENIFLNYKSFKKLNLNSKL